MAMLLSSDENHAAAPKLPVDRFLSVTSGNGIFVALGESGALITSSDGEGWSQQSSGTRDVLLGVTFGNGLFVAVGGAGTILTSSDGVAWTKRDSGTVALLGSVVHGSGSFVAVGNGPERGIILTSDDGTTWTDHSPTNPARTWLRDVTYGKGIFVTIGYEGESLEAATWVSTDGATWNWQRLGTAASLHRITFGNDRFLAVGTNGQGELMTLTSLNGMDWTRQNLQSSQWINDLAFGAGLFLAVGTEFGQNSIFSAAGSAAFRIAIFRGGKSE